MGGRRSFPFWMAYFQRRAVSFRECTQTFIYHKPANAPLDQRISKAFPTLRVPTETVNIQQQSREPLIFQFPIYLEPGLVSLPDKLASGSEFT